MRKGLFVLIFSASVGHALAADGTPIAIVKELAALNAQAGRPPLFANTPTPIMRKYFSSAFNLAWAKAMKHNKDFPVFDADPLTGEQSGGEIGAVTAHMEAPNLVLANMPVRDGPPQPVEFLMIRSAAGDWLIDDIIYRERKSLRVILAAVGR
jgi:hypothetical protein